MSFNIAAINSGEPGRMSQQLAEHAPESFFVAQLAEHAKSSVAVPHTGFVIDNLSYLSHDELSLVEQAHAYATHAHEGQSRRTGHAYITTPPRSLTSFLTCAWIRRLLWRRYCTT